MEFYQPDKYTAIFTTVFLLFKNKVFNISLIIGQGTTVQLCSFKTYFCNGEMQENSILISHEEALAVLTDHEQRMKVIELISDTTPDKEIQLSNIRLAKMYLDNLSKCFVFRINHTSQLKTELTSLAPVSSVDASIPETSESVRGHYGEGWNL